MTKFNPNVSSFEEGIERIEEALSETGFEARNKIVTSQDKGIEKLLNLLAGDNVPDGFKKWQLPFAFDKGQFFISVAQPNAIVPKHAHDSGDALRVIISGSVFYKDKELKSGDWMYVPKGMEYEITVGNYGVTMCYCYRCTCVPRLLNRGEDVLQPNPYLKK